jgi:tetratricopeptide (TPR) repeat protein
MKHAMARAAFLIAMAVLPIELPAGQLQDQAPPCADGQTFFRQRQWADAANAFAECEQHNPGQTDALLLRGKSLINSGEYDDAEKALQAYAQAHPTSDDAAYLLAYIAFRKDKPEESLRLFTAAAKLKTPTANDLKIVALDYVLLSDYHDAAHYLELSLQMDPDDVEAHYHLGRVHFQQNAFDLAISDFREVVRRDPNSVKGHDNLGLSLEAKNQNDQAVAEYQKAIELDKAPEAHTDQPYLNLGTLLVKLNRPNDAIPLLVRAAEINPAEGKSHFELSKAYVALDRFSDARPQAEEAVKLSPQDSSAHYLLGRIYQRLGDGDLAKEQFRVTAKLIREKDATAKSGMASGDNSR